MSQHGGSEEQMIRERAYAIWQREGCPRGRDVDHWLAAKNEVAAEAATANIRATAYTQTRPAQGQRVPAKPVTGKAIRAGKSPAEQARARNSPPTVTGKARTPGGRGKRPKTPA